jgi:glycosyltransferase involved in cell wall biosynthesis
MKFNLPQAQEKLPASLLCGEERLPANRPPRLLSAQAFALSLESSFSGITYHLAKAGLLTGHLEGCFSLYSGAKPLRAVQVRGAIWKALRLLQQQKTSGFKFTGAYLDEVWPRYIQYLAGCTLVSNFQLYGRQFLKQRRQLGIGTYYYIDGTLKEYFESYGDFDVANIDDATRRHAIELEQEGYDAADGIVAFSRLTAQALKERYGVPSSKISVVVPGANLLDEALESLEISQPPAAASDDFVIGFVGLYPIRKGLDRLAGAVQILRARGLPVRLRVIGKCPDELLRMDGLEYLGIINKRTDLTEFIRSISSVHLGCLVSRSELGGVAMVEFLRVGVPVLGTRVGGATDILEGGGTVMVSPDIDAEELAEVIAALHHDRSRYAVLKQEAEARRGWASWKRVAAELDAVLP